MFSTSCLRKTIQQYKINNFALINNATVACQIM